MASEQTRIRILEAAESLFLRQGPDATSMRQLSKSAKVGLAAINYHFGSKEKLIAEVATRLNQPVFDAQHDRLLALDGASDTASLPDIVRAFLEPYLEMAATPDGPAILQLGPRVLTSSVVEARSSFERPIEAIADVMQRLIRRANPALRPAEVAFRLVSLVAVMSWYQQGFFEVGARAAISRKALRRDTQLLVAELVGLLSAPPAGSS